MIIIIDAYNILKNLTRESHSTEGQRQEFINLLSRYSKYRKHKLLAVFDGGDYERPAYFKQEGVTVIYSGYTVTADEVIISLLKTFQIGSAIVISNDREIVGYAKQYKAQIVSSEQFYELLSQALRTPTIHVTKDKVLPQKREGHQSSIEVDNLMKLASTVLVHKDEYLDFLELESHTKAETVSKKEKKNLRVTKKL